MKPVRYLSNYDTVKFEDQMKRNFKKIESSILEQVEREDISRAILEMDNHIDNKVLLKDLRQLSLTITA